MGTNLAHEASQDARQLIIHVRNRRIYRVIEHCLTFQSVYRDSRVEYRNLL